MCVHVHVHMCNCRSTVRGQKLTEDVYLYGNPSHFETESLTESGAYWFIWAAWVTGQWTPESDDLHIPCPSPENTCVYVTIPRFYMDRDLNSNPQAFAEHLNHQMTFQAIVQYVRLKKWTEKSLIIKFSNYFLLLPGKFLGVILISVFPRLHKSSFRIFLGYCYEL